MVFINPLANQESLILWPIQVLRGCGPCLANSMFIPSYKSNTPNHPNLSPSIYIYGMIHRDNIWIKHGS